jgi:NAD(P)-dependent dehydrogenase (short-subunit alcohol dehydrogenase family)
VIDQAVARFGRVDAMLNVAGIAAGGPIESLEAVDLRCMLDVNLQGMFLGAKYAVLSPLRSTGPQSWVVVKEGVA